MATNPTNTSIAALHITVSTPFDLVHTAPAKPTALTGNYIATPQAGSHPLAYDLTAADQNWVPQGPKLASAFIEVLANGTARII